MGGRKAFGLIAATGLAATSLSGAHAAAGPQLAYRLADLPAESRLSWSRAPAPGPRADDNDLNCLTAAVYYEARSEAEDGQRAVAQVVLNRVNKPSFARSVCGVVHQRAAGGCQFKFICDGAERGRRDFRAWAAALRVARAALSGLVFDRIGGATFYHTVAVQPGWSQRLTRVAVIGSHIFYRSRTS